MKRFILCILMLTCFLTGTPSSAGNGSHDPVLAGFISRLSSSAVSFTYEFLIDDGKVKVDGAGTVDMQGNAYHMTGNGLDVYCDGAALYVLDRAAKELVVEPVDAVEPDYNANPVLLLSSFDKAFRQVSSSVKTAAGQKVHLITLETVVDSEIADLTVVVSERDLHLLSATVQMKNGTVNAFTIPSFRFSEPGDLSRFSFDMSVLDESFIVTDLR